ncbi:MAG: acetyltransferase [Actinomycetia bacterium]|jgi:ribosomal protein S18 acetylase RimI-like enzyme|nr:acetyltransferase [Actinomycetes bacterium]
MDLVVARTPDGWTVRHGEAVVGQAVAFVRPDSRCFVAFRSCCAEAYRPLVQAIAEHLRRDLHTEIDEADAEVRDRLVGLGFVISRREHIYTIPTDPTVTGLSNVALPAGLEVVTADRVDEDLLRELDDELKQDVPGADGWKWDRQGFRKETYDAPDFDPATYLVAIEQASGRYAGLVRVWNRPGGPRLGLIGVGRLYRRRGLARSLLAQAFGVLHDRGKAEVVAEVDVTNTGSNRLLARLGAWRIGGFTEMICPWPRRDRLT